MMLRKGDRIVTVHPEANDVSGIVAFASEVGRGYFIVLIQADDEIIDGKETRVCDFETVFVFDIDIVERDVPVPEVPEVGRRLIVQAAFRTGQELHAKRCKRQREIDAIARRRMPTNITETMATLPPESIAKLGGAPWRTIAEALMHQSVLVSREKKYSTEFLESMYVACKEWATKMARALTAGEAP